jgi:hypothetical protein
MQEMAKIMAIQDLLADDSIDGLPKEELKKRMQEVLAGTQERFGLSSLRQSERDKLYRACKSQRFLLAVKVHQIIDHVRKCGKFRITNNDIVFLESLLITSFQCGTEHLIEVLTDLFEEIKSDTSKEAATVRHKMCVYYTPICNPEYGEIMEENGIALLDHTAFSNSALVTGSSDPCEDAALENAGDKDVSRRVYSITNKGRACLGNWQVTLRSYAASIAELVDKMEETAGFTEVFQKL